MTHFDLNDLRAPKVDAVLSRLVVLTQTCDLANRKV
jgi:hypothetical protein